MALVKLNPENLLYIPKAIRDFVFSDRCMMSLKFIGENSQDAGLSDDDYIKVCVEAIRKNLSTIQHIDDKYKLLAINTLGEDSYTKICIESAKKDPATIQYMDDKYQAVVINSLGKEFCLALAKFGANYISYIPKINRDFDVTLQIIKQDAESLRSIGKNSQDAGLSEEDYTKICIEAVKIYPAALQYMDDKYKLIVINTIGPETLLTPDYSLVDYFPKNAHFQSLPHKFLSNIEHLAVTKREELYHDKEINDASMV